MSVLADVCLRVGEKGLADELVERRRRYEAGAEYPQVDE